jgi:hypothetical protein
MMLREGRVRLLVLGAAAFVMLVGASDPLRPLVMRTEQPRGAAPAECDEGLSPAPALRVDAREIPLPEEVAPVPATAANVPAPPRGELRGALESVQTALARNNRAAFDEALVRTRLIVEKYPAGGERRSAEELIRIYEGAGRLWEAQYQSPFFSTESPEYAAASAYPGYQEAVRRSTLTDAAGRKFYPASESREFLTRVAADRLNRLGVRVPTPSTPRLSSSSSSSSSRPSASASASSSSSPSRSTSSKPRRTTSSSSSRSSISRPRTTSTTTTTTTRKPAATKPAPSTPNPSAPPTVAAEPAPAAPSAAPPAAGDSASTAAPAPAVTSDPVVITDTTPTAVAPITPPPDAPVPATSVTTDTAASTPATPEPTTEPTRGRSVILPTILILIGLGVLIVLFRASK